MAERKITGGGKTGLNISNQNVYEAVRKRAYELFLKRGCTDGDDMKDWLEAERQVKKELGAPR